MEMNDGLTLPQIRSVVEATAPAWSGLEDQAKETIVRDGREIRLSFLGMLINAKGPSLREVCTLANFLEEQTKAGHIIARMNIITLHQLAHRAGGEREWFPEFIDKDCTQHVHDPNAVVLNSLARYTLCGRIIPICRAVGTPDKERTNKCPTCEKHMQENTSANKPGTPRSMLMAFTYMDIPELRADEPNTAADLNQFFKGKYFCEEGCIPEPWPEAQEPTAPFVLEKLSHQKAGSDG